MSSRPHLQAILPPAISGGGLLLRLAGRAEWGEAVWALATVPMLISLLVEIIRSLGRGETRTHSCSSRSALWRLLDRRDITKKACGQPSRIAPMWRARRRWIRQQGFLDTTRLVFIDETATSTNMARPRGRWLRGERLISHVRTDTGRRSPLWPVQPAARICAFAQARLFASGAGASRVTDTSRNKYWSASLSARRTRHVSVSAPGLAPSSSCPRSARR